MENRYYIAVPTKVKRFSYQTIFTWKNYSFTGTHDEIVSGVGLWKDYSNEFKKNGTKMRIGCIL